MAAMLVVPAVATGADTGGDRAVADGRGDDAAALTWVPVWDDRDE